MARVVGLVALVMLLAPQDVRAWWHWRATRVAAYYCPAPAYAAVPVYASVVPSAVPVFPYTPLVWPVAPAPAVPATLAPAPPVVPAVPAVPNLAQPSTAPPSSGPAPYPGTSGSGPTSTRGLKPIAQTDRYFDSYVVAPPEGGLKTRSEHQPVSFWNQSGHDAVVRIDGQEHALAPGKRLDVVLGPQFVWQLVGHEGKRAGWRTAVQGSIS